MRSRNAGAGSNFSNIFYQLFAHKGHAFAVVFLLSRYLFHGHRFTVVPVAVKHVGGLIDNGANGECVQVAEVIAFVISKVLRCDIAPTNNGGLVIYGE